MDTSALPDSAFGARALSLKGFTHSIAALNIARLKP